MEKRTWNSDTSFVNFQSGISLGLGLFNLLLSVFPEKIKKLLSIVGFSVSNQDGIDYLIDCGNSRTWRSFGAQMLLATYETYMLQMFNAHTTESLATAAFTKEALITNPNVSSTGFTSY